TLGYFDDILIPTHDDDGWKFDHETQVWVRLWDSHIPEESWKTPEDKYVYMYMDKGATIRFRVIEEKFTDVGTKRPPPKRTGAVAGQKAPMPSSSSLPSDVMIVGNNRITPNVNTDSTINPPSFGNNQTGNITSTSIPSSSTSLTIPGKITKQAPYELIGSIAEVGLGITSWTWDH
ncbi:88_t:CDS:2, partial [Scutellospora calospora]